MSSSSDILVSPAGLVTWRGRDYRCALGRSGIVADKREGDGGTPVGRFPLRRVFFRPDRMDEPETRLPVSPLNPHAGWCDDPADEAYNRFVHIPYRARAEKLWREDGVYDVIVVLGHNDAPPLPGLGSAIFLHVAQPDFAPTEGCVALAYADLLAVLNDCDAATHLTVLSASV